MKNLLQRYMNRLTNLNANNRSILLLRLVSDQFVDLHSSDFLAGQPSFHLVEGLVAGKASQTICPTSDPRDQATNKLSQHLRKLQRIAKFIYEERGSQDLYVGWPFVEGQLNDGTLVRAPLAFFPVALEQRADQWVLVRRTEVAASLNKSFLMAYAYYNEVKVDEAFLEQQLDDWDTDSRVFRTTLYQTFKDSPIDLAFDQDLFLDQLKPFHNYRRKEMLDQTKQGELRTRNEAVLGIFPQAGSYLVPDYVHLLEQEETFGSLEEFFESRQVRPPEGNASPEYFRFINRIKEEELITPFPIDAHQENAIKAVKEGHSVVVQGPPGTGKSQLICNLVADAIARQKRVLVVCQKRAALDVVFERLSQLGLGPFAALVHDFRNDRRDIYDKVTQQVDSLNDYRQQNNTLDAIQLERRYLQVCRQIDQLTSDLEEFRQALFDTSDCGLSAKELYMTSSPSEPAVPLRQVYDQFSFGDFDAVKAKLGEVVAFSEKLDADTHPWAVRHSFAELKPADRQTMKKLLEAMPTELNSFAEKSGQLLQGQLGLDEGETVAKHSHLVAEFLQMVRPNEVFEAVQKMMLQKKPGEIALWLSTMRNVMSTIYYEPGPELRLSTPELGRFQAALERMRLASENLFQWWRWKSFSKERAYLRPIFTRNGQKLDKAGIEHMIQMVDKRLNLEHNLSRLREKGYLELPAAVSRVDMGRWFVVVRRAAKARQLFAPLMFLTDYIQFGEISYADLRKKLTGLVDLCLELREQKHSWAQWLSSQQLAKTYAQPSHSEVLLRSLDRDFESLVLLDQRKAQLSPMEGDLLQTVSNHFDGQPTEESFLRLLDNSLRLAWLDHLETKHPVLRTVSSMAFDRQESQLQELVVEKEQLSKEILLLKVRERTYQNVEYNRLNNPVTYRDLAHQAGKKRLLWPLRKLIHHHADELFELMPVWLASPESVSAMFPMRKLVDLVIFDEASQCFSENGIPSMFRGSQVVITGDAQQLSPFDLYRVRWEEEDSEDRDLEVDSLLDLGSNYLMQMRLEGHYRSKSLPLIAFSNEHFYDNRLQLLEDKAVTDSREQPVEFINVHGVWEDQQNQAEADRVVDLVWQLAQNEPQLTVGVVTFNSRQQGLIMDQLDNHFAEKGQPLPPHLFVKNIENVQGDERDIILFSTAYAPDATGKLRLQFGSLNLPKGENRLNVAVTRARQRVVVVTSLEPHELKVDHVKNKGPKLLQAYLAYAKEVSQGKFTPAPYNTGTVHFHESLAKALQRQIPEQNPKVEARADLPFADLTVYAGQQAQALLLTDDALYHSARSVKDAHVYQPLLMHQKGWVHRRFYSRNYWGEHQVLSDRLQAFLGRLGEQQP